MSQTHRYDTRLRSRMAENEMQQSVEESDASLNRSDNLTSTPFPPERQPQDTFQQALAQGKAFGYQGADLQKYVEDFQRKAAEREAAERAAKRVAAERAAAAEREERRAREEADRQAQLAREERQAQLAREEAERQAQLAREEAIREHEYRMAQLAQQQTQAAEVNANNSATSSQQKTKASIKLRIPFLEDKDNVETWFIQFERTAEDHELSDTQKARQVFYYLKGKARDLYSKMATEEQEDYEIVKATILKGFNLTSEDYRARFRNARRKENESLRELAVRLIDYFQKWIHLEEAEEDVDCLKFLMVKEQLFQIYPADLVQYIVDGDISSEKGLLDRVDSFESRQKILRTHNKALNKGGKSPQKGKHNFIADSKANQNADHKPKISEKEIARRKKEHLCLNCGKADHYAKQCPDKKGKGGEVSCVSCQEVGKPHMVIPTGGPNPNTKPGEERSAKEETISTELSQLCKECQGKPFQNLVRVRINGVETTALRDTGCSGIIVSPELVCQSQYSSKVVKVTLASTEVTKPLKVAIVNIDSPYFHADTEVTVMEKPIYPVLIGQTHGLDRKWQTTPLFPVREPDWYNSAQAAVVTRLQAKTPQPSSSGTGYMTQSLKPAELRKAQQEDPSLRKIRQFAETSQVIKGVSYVYRNEVLLRVVTDHSGTKHSKVVVPENMRDQVLKLGHDNALAGHLGNQKTTDRILLEFWWPGIVADIKRYVASCDACQRTYPRGRVPRAPMGKMPPVDVMFRRVAVDIVGPIHPMSETQKRYILVVVDYNTMYPEAVALENIKAETVLDALWEMWTRLGIPDEIITDQGSQFSGHLMAEVKRLWLVKHHMTATFRTQANGLVEKFNRTLKSMLRKLTLEQPKKWDTFLPALLFAYREVPQNSTGVSPFEMLYGRKVKGPMQILREIWTMEDLPHQMKTSAEYVLDLRNQIGETCRIAQDHLSKAQRVQAKYFDRCTRRRVLQPGQQVLLLEPSKNNKLELTWKGPYQVLEQISDVDYRIQMDAESRVFHINLVKPYQKRENASSILKEVECDGGADQVISGRNVCSTVIVAEEPTSEVTGKEWKENRNVILPAATLMNDDKIVNMAPQLTEQPAKQVHELCEDNRECDTDTPKPIRLEEMAKQHGTKQIWHGKERQMVCTKCGHIQQKAKRPQLSYLLSEDTFRDPMSQEGQTTQEIIRQAARQGQG